MTTQQIDELIDNYHNNFKNSDKVSIKIIFNNETIDEIDPVTNIELIEDVISINNGYYDYSFNISNIKGFELETNK